MRPLVVALFGVLALTSVTAAHAQIVVAPGYALETVATGLPASSNSIAVAPAAFGAYGGQVFLVDRGTFGSLVDGEVVRIDPASGIASPFAQLDGNPSFADFRPGGGFGSDLYVTGTQDPLSTSVGIIHRVDATGSSVVFGSPTPPGGYLYGGVGMALSDSGPFGQFLYTGTGAGNPSDALSRVATAGGTAALFDDFDTVLNGSPTELVFGDLGGTIGFKLFVGMNVISGGQNVETGIYAIDAAAARTPIATTSGTPELTGVPRGLTFGQGGGFGLSLYAGLESGRVLRIDGPSTITPIVDGLTAAMSVAISPDAPEALYVLDVDTGSDEATLYRIVRAVSVPTHGNPLLLVVLFTAAGVFYSARAAGADRLPTPAAPHTASMSKTCLSMRSGRPRSTTPRASWRRTNWA